MKLYYSAFLFFFVLMTFKTSVQAQTPCDAITATVIYPTPQSGPYNYYGAKVSIAQGYSENITVVGNLVNSEDPTHTQQFTLTIPSGELSAETYANVFQVSPTAGAEIQITSISSCPSSVSLQINQVNDQSMANRMVNAFNSLNVDLTQLSLDLGLSFILSDNDVDFQNLYSSYDANSAEGVAISAPFLINSTSSTKYTFVLYTDGTNYGSPMIIVSTNQYLKYFDLRDGYITTLNNYNLSNYSFSTTVGNYINNNQPMASVNYLNLDLKNRYAGATQNKYNLANYSFPAAIENYIQTNQLSPSGCGQYTADCINDLYARRGWVTVWAWVQTAFIPWTAAVVAARCAAACILN